MPRLYGATLPCGHPNAGYNLIRTASVDECRKCREIARRHAKELRPTIMRPLSEVSLSLSYAFPVWDRFYNLAPQRNTTA